MTGYGKSVVETDSLEISLEVKSVNNRYLDINIKQPIQFLEYELGLRKIVKERLKRGSVNIYINVQKKQGGSQSSSFNMENLKELYKNMLDISNKLGMEEPSWANLLQFDQIYEKNSSNDEDLKSSLNSCLNGALDDLISFRISEGEKLKIEIGNYISNIRKTLSDIEDLKESSTQIQFKRLKERLSKNLTDIKVSEERLCQELAIISDKVDISEEVTRLNSHLDLFDKALNSDESLGQRLNFITQEMHREANTISAKTNLTDISTYSVKLKENIEKIREQVQNIE